MGINYGIVQFELAVPEGGVIQTTNFWVELVGSYKTSLVLLLVVALLNFEAARVKPLTIPELLKGLAPDGDVQKQRPPPLAPALIYCHALMGWVGCGSIMALVELLQIELVPKGSQRSAETSVALAAVG